jgi:hypothetical protein
MADKKKGIFAKFFDSIAVFNPRMTENNESLDTFVKLEAQDNNPEVESVIDSYIEGQQSAGGVDAVNAYKNLVYGALSSDKPRRLGFFRNMARFPEVADAIDEICDSCVNRDENNNLIDLEFKDNRVKLTDDQITQINKEFESFIALFDFETRGFDHFRSLVVDGELAFENIVDKKHTDSGIVNVRRIQPECYEYLVDLSYEVVGILLNAQMVKDPDMKSPEYGQKSKYSQRALHDKGFKNIRNNYQSRNEKEDLIPMPIKQITLIDTGRYNEDKSIVYPILERARRAYRQLSLIEDAVIIYRLVRAPERLVFNVDTGKLNHSKAEQIVKRMMHRYQSKKIYDPVNGTVVNDYDPHQMMESYWFPKPEGSNGTTVESLGGAGSLGELEDLQYFLRKLYLSLKVPYNRFEEPTTGMEKGETLSYEEYRFAKFIMRIQAQMARGLTESFISHLQLVGIWKKFKLNRRSFCVMFTPPTSFELYEQQKLLNLKMENYATATQNEGDFSKDLAKKKFLGMTDNEIQQHQDGIEKERIREAMLERKVSNVEEYGTPDGPPDGEEDYQ